MRLRILLLLGLISGCKEAPSPSATPTPTPTAVRSPLQEALALAAPKGLSIAFFDGGTIVGSGQTYDDVSEFMRGLNNIAWCPQGFCRLVERPRSGMLRFELLDGGELVEYAPGKVHHYFSSLQLKSTGTVDGSVQFEITQSFPPY